MKIWKAQSDSDYSDQPEFFFFFKKTKKKKPMRLTGAMTRILFINNLLQKQIFNVTIFSEL